VLVLLSVLSVVNVALISPLLSFCDLQSLEVPVFYSDPA
jgi:hypothetical protein